MATKTTFFLSIFLPLAFVAIIAANDPPNIVVILADDLGFGDVTPNNPDSKIPTPSFERLAKEGVNFTDAHSGSGVCTPTRYGLVCGKYCWRTQLKRGVLNGFSKPLIDEEQQTIAGILKAAGYRTACIGKWHLGLGWQGDDKQTKRVDYSKPITDGPTSHGFDESYIIPASLDMSPYVYVKNDQATTNPSETINARGFPKFYRKGEIGVDFEHVNCLTHLLNQANAFITAQAKTNQPFFLYFPMPAPHKPVIPEDRFRDKTAIGPYGDFVHQVDWTIGEVLKTLDSTDAAAKTIVIVTSDNGSFMHRYDDAGKRDHTDDESIQGYRRDNHVANGPLRGTKADIWEAGHRVPFFVRWPDKTRAGETESTTICLTDILATSAQIAGAPFEKSGSPDSFSFAHCFGLPPTQENRPHVINHSAAGMFAIRDGKWKLVLGNGSGGRQTPKGKPFTKPYHLSNLESDLGETKNFAEDYPEVEAGLIAAFEEIVNGDQITPKKNKNSNQKPKANKAR
ncbi:MAG: arylsulfatase [Mariniblastus sp.]|nr:arylsulfatase [Mariniblastus sp.]